MVVVLPAPLGPRKANNSHRPERRGRGPSTADPFVPNGPWVHADYFDHCHRGGFRDPPWGNRVQSRPWGSGWALTGRSLTSGTETSWRSTKPSLPYPGLWAPRGVCCTDLQRGQPGWLSQWIHRPSGATSTRTGLDSGPFSGFERSRLHPTAGPPGDRGDSPKRLHRILHQAPLLVGDRPGPWVS